MINIFVYSGSLEYGFKDYAEGSKSGSILFYSLELFRWKYWRNEVEWKGVLSRV